MALNKVFAETQSKNRERAVPEGTQPGTPLIINTRPAVALTARGDATKTSTLPDGVSVSFANGGVGNLPDSASVAFDGTWLFEGVTGVTATTGQDVAIYLTSAGALTATATGNTLFGYTDYPRDFAKATGRAAVRIGA